MRTPVKDQPLAWVRWWYSMQRYPLPEEDGMQEVRPSWRQYPVFVDPHACPHRFTAICPECVGEWLPCFDVRIDESIARRFDAYNSRAVKG